MDSSSSLSPPPRRLKRLRKASTSLNLPLQSTPSIDPRIPPFKSTYYISPSQSQTLQLSDHLIKEAERVLDFDDVVKGSTAEISLTKSTAEISLSKAQALEISDYSDGLAKKEENREAKRSLDFDDVAIESTAEISLSKSRVLGLSDIKNRQAKRVLEFDDVATESVDSFEGLGKKEKEGREAKQVLDFDDVATESTALQFSDHFDELEKKEENREAKRVLSFDESEKEQENREAKTGLDFDESGKEMFDSGESQNVGFYGDFDGLEKKGEIGDSDEGFSDDKQKINNINNKKKKKKRGRNDDEDDDGRGKSSVSNKRKQLKDRQMYLQQLHVESQKLLRESRDATFKATPVVHKPISSVLEKIRKRKLEVMKKSLVQKTNCDISENNAPFREVIANDGLENVSTGERKADKSPKVLQEKTLPCENNSDDSLSNDLKETPTIVEEEDSPSRMVMDEQPMDAFRAPLDDTQDLCCDSPISEEKENVSDDQNSYPLEEEFAPSVLAMNLKFDSAPPDDDISSDEEDNDKENVKPSPDVAGYKCSSPNGDPVKAFLDEEAEEEDNSDHDMRFNENEEDDIEDYEDLQDLIATGYEENTVDNDKRKELHKKWLEQQDTSGTDNLMQRLKYGSKLKENSLFEDEEEEDVENDEVFHDEAVKDPFRSTVARVTIRKAKQMIPQLFSDKNDGYLSDEEEAEKRLTKKRVLDKVEEQFALAPPAEDENSREVFGLIKKLNIMPDTKKKSNPPSIFDKMLTGAKTNGFSKSSFVGRNGNHSVPSVTKKGTSTVRSFIFGRDDSNSRGSLSVSEDSSDMIIEDTRPTKNVVTKFSSSQSKVSSQINKSTAEISGDVSLFNILKRSSVQSSVSSTVSITQNVFDVFRIPKKSEFERRI